MRRRILIIFLLLPFLTSCEKLFMEEDLSPDPETTFEYLWQRVDAMYSHFEVKPVDWQVVHDTTLPLVQQCRTNVQLFQVLGGMLNTLQDGHVNLISGFDVSHCTDLYRLMQERKNINGDVVMSQYLGYDYHTTGGLVHQVIADSQVVYVRYSSFMNSVSPSVLNYVFRIYPHTRGVIFDIRQNGGGQVDHIWQILKMLPATGQLLYTTQIKSGSGRNDFSAPTAVYAPDADADFAPYSKPFCLLTDRGSYSAASLLTLALRSYPTVTIVGDTTGGGLGLPNGGDLPNGWHYRFSITRTLSPEGYNFENGVPPDTVVMLSPEAVVAGKDNVIETAVSIILSQSKE